MNEVTILSIIALVCGWSWLCFSAGYQQKQQMFKYRCREIKASYVLAQLKRGDSIVFSIPPEE
mgnify:CR=1 FL=1